MPALEARRPCKLHCRSFPRLETLEEELSERLSRIEFEFLRKQRYQAMSAMISFACEINNIHSTTNNNSTYRPSR